MKQLIEKYLIIAALLLIPFSMWGQKKIYTRSFQIQDFKSKTTKVVLSGSPSLNAALRQEVTSLWTISPYEFCSKEEYEKQKNSPDCYFLHPEVNKGIVYLNISRGGKQGETEATKMAINLVSMAVAGERDESRRESIYMPAYILMLQDFVEAALNSEYVAYTGMKAICKRAPKGLQIYTEPDEADEAFISQYTDSAAQVVITPDGKPESKPRYKILIGTSGYELYSYGKN